MWRLFFHLNIPRSDEKSKEFFKSLLPDDPQISTRPLFGNISAFVNGNMFAGLFGNDIFVRLPDEIREELLSEKGASYLELMKGKPMKDYVVMPAAWKNKPEKLRLWLSRSLDSTSKLPPKKTRK